MIDILFTIAGALVLTLLVCILFIEIKNIQNGNTDDEI
jgi:hypothetical protein